MIEKNIEILDIVYFLVTRYGYEQVRLSPHDPDFYLFNKKAKTFTLIRLTTESMSDHIDKKEVILSKAEKVGDLFNAKINLLSVHFTDEETDLFFEPGYYQAQVNKNGMSPILVKEYPSITNALLPVSGDLESDLENRRQKFTVYNEDKQKKQNLKNRLISEKPKLQLTHILIILNVLMFVAGIFITMKVNKTFSYVFMGALYKPLIVGANEWYRILTTGFIHGDFLHLLVNMIALLQIGMLVEKVFGKKPMLFIYFASLLTSSLFTLAKQDPSYLAVGASGAIFGLLGAVIVYLFSSGLYKIKAVRGQIVRTLFVNFLISLIPGVSFYGHAGGLMGGVIAALAVSKSDTIKSAVIPAYISLAMIISGLFTYNMFFDTNVFPINKNLDKLVVLGYAELGFEKHAVKLLDMYEHYYEEIGEEFK